MSEPVIMRDLIKAANRDGAMLKIDGDTVYVLFHGSDRHYVAKHSRAKHFPLTVVDEDGKVYNIVVKIDNKLTKGEDG